MKSLVDLSRILLLECGSQCGVKTSMDISVLVNRVEKEGVSFLTITLPSFATSLERAIARGRVALSDFPGWRKASSGLPRFLGGFLNHIFDKHGNLRDQVNPDVVFLLRQFLLHRKKVWAVANETRQARALRGYLDCEESIDVNFRSDTFRAVCSVVVLSLFDGSDQRFNSLDIIGKHGPGSTADRKTANGRYQFTAWPSRLEHVFPHGYHAFNTEESYLRDAGSINSLSEENETPVKVIFVPKTMKTPRVIAIEPSWNQFIQQGIMRWLVPRIEAAEYTSGRVNFRDQTINQRLALQSSRDGRLATIDMKEASDRVSMAHVDAMFSAVPDFLEAVKACRTTRAQLPDGQVVTLRKFASMGSALCFPVEALAFFCGVVAGRIESRGLPVTSSNVRKYAKDVYVFGDDIIIPADETPVVIDWLESLGFLVNRNKSFWTGSFRESCGVDAYDGTDITPSYCRFDLDPSDPQSIVSWVSFGNQLYQKGLWRTARYVREQVEKVVLNGRPLGPLPFVDRHSGAMGWKNFSNSTTHRRWNKRLHRLEDRCITPKPTKRPDALEGYPALFKSLQVAGSEAVDPKHLRESVRPWSLELKARWTSS